MAFIAAGKVGGGWGVQRHEWPVQRDDAMFIHSPHTQLNAATPSEQRLAIFSLAGQHSKCCSQQQGAQAGQHLLGSIQSSWSSQQQQGAQAPPNRRLTVELHQVCVNAQQHGHERGVCGTRTWRDGAAQGL